MRRTHDPRYAPTTRTAQAARTARPTGLPRLPAAAARALQADGLTTLDDVVEAGWLHVASLPGVDATAMARLDAAITAVGRAGSPDGRVLAATA